MPETGRQTDVIHARKCQDFTLSGDLQHFKTAGDPAAEIDRCWDGSPAGALASVVYCLWSEKALYFGFSCPFTELSMDTGTPGEQPRWALWDLDIAEVLISPMAQPVDHYYEFEVAPSGHWLDLEVVFCDGRPFYRWEQRFHEMVRSKIDLDRRIWTAELKIAVAGLSRPTAKPGDEWSLNLLRADGPAEARRYLALWPTLTPEPDFHVPSRFGRMRLVE